jgi:hypothetical protein
MVYIFLNKSVADKDKQIILLAWQAGHMGFIPRN